MSRAGRGLVLMLVLAAMLAACAGGTPRDAPADRALNPRAIVGFYTCFASRGFTCGQTPGHWPSMQRWAEDNGLRFIPSVGPGYLDARVRPRDGANTRDRDDGRYYDDMFAAAIASGAAYIAITSFNEWHEGTQIEPAVPHPHQGRVYLDDASRPPDHYLRRTRHWLSRHPPGLQPPPSR